MKSRFLSFTILSFFISFGSFAQEMNISVEEETTTMEFETTDFDFGTINSGDKVAYVFKFTNTGDLPLVIKNAKGSCGCTVPFFPKDPIMPGETSEIEVEFNSKGKKGKQSKRVTITANTSPSQTFLTVKGVINVVEETSTDEDDAAVAQRNKEREEMKALNPSCFAIYPNPTSETLQLELKEHIGKSAVIDIHNKMGQKVMDKKIDRISRETTRFDVSNFSAGTYMISIRVEGHKPMTQCFVVSD